MRVSGGEFELNMYPLTAKQLRFLRNVVKEQEETGEGYKSVLN